MGAGAGLQNDSSVLHLLISLSRKQSSGSNVSNSNGCKDEASVACWPLTSYCVARSRLGKRKVKVLVAQSCPTLGNPMDCSLPGFFVHGISQARILEWLPFPSAGNLPDPGIKLEFPLTLALPGKILTTKPPGNTLQHFRLPICPPQAC